MRSFCIWDKILTLIVLKATIGGQQSSLTRHRHLSWTITNPWPYIVMVPFVCCYVVDEPVVCNSSNLLHHPCQCQWHKICQRGLLTLKKCNQNNSGAFSWYLAQLHLWHYISPSFKVGNTVKIGDHVVCQILVSFTLHIYSLEIKNMRPLKWR